MEEKLPLCKEQFSKINMLNVLDDLLEAVKYLSIYETKIKDIRLESYIYMPNLEINEAVSSLKIEGTYTKLEDYYSDQVNPDDSKLEVKELTNFISAIKKGTYMVKADGFSNENIKEMHRIMFSAKNTLKNGAIAGEYKRCNNFLKRDNITIYNPPSYKETETYMNDLINFINKIDSIHPLIKCAIIHAQFESIHPFEDGNGRMGRILIPIYLCYTKLLDAPLFYLSEAIEKDKFQYYSTLQGTRNGDYDSWIKFFLKKCVLQTKKHIDLIENINRLYDLTRERIIEITNSVIAEKLLKAVFRNPIINSKKLSESCDISLSQANRHLKALTDARILFANEKKRNVTYGFGELLNLIYH